MIIHDEVTQRAVARLAGNPDFKLFMELLDAECAAATTELMNSLNTNLVHQLQGTARILVDIQRAVMLAPTAVQALTRNR